MTLPENKGDVLAKASDTPYSEGGSVHLVPGGLPGTPAGHVVIEAGSQLNPNKNTGGEGGQVIIKGGQGWKHPDITNKILSGSVQVQAGDALATSGVGGSFVQIESGLGDAETNTNSGDIVVSTPANTGKEFGTGSIYFETGNAVNNSAGDIVVSPGTQTGKSGRQGLFLVHNLPTTDPKVEGALYTNGSVLMVSEGQ